MKIAQVRQSTAQTKTAAKSAHSDKKSRINDAKLDQIDGAADKRDSAIDKARQPVIAADAKIAELQRQLAAAELEREAKGVVFSAKKGELKSAYKQAVAAIKDTATGHIAKVEAEARINLRSRRERAGDRPLMPMRAPTLVAKDGRAGRASDDWQTRMKWEGRKAGFNAVAETVKAIVQAVQTTYRDNRDAARANVRNPGGPARAPQQEQGGPTPPAP